MASGKRQWVKSVRPPLTMVFTTDTKSPMVEPPAMSDETRLTENKDHVCGRRTEVQIRFLHFATSHLVGTQQTCQGGLSGQMNLKQLFALNVKCHLWLNKYHKDLYVPTWGCKCHAVGVLHVSSPEVWWQDRQEAKIREKPYEEAAEVLRLGWRFSF